MGSKRRRLLNQLTHSSCGELHGFEVAPWSSSMDDLGLVKTVDRLGESIVVGTADASDGRFDARLRQPFGIANGHVLNGKRQGDPVWRRGGERSDIGSGHDEVM